MSPSSSTKARFVAAAVKDEAGELYMGPEEFTNAIAPAGEDYHRIHRDQYTILFKVADRSKSGKVSLADWEFFEALVSKPDAEYQIAFRLFGGSSESPVTHDSFKKVYEENCTANGIPLNLDSEWMRLHMGTSKHRHSLDYDAFSQLLRGLQGERIRQAFVHFDRSGSGFITPEQFETIIRDTTGHKLSDHTIEHLSQLCRGGVESTTDKVPYATVRAFRNVVDGMDLIEKIVKQACSESADGKISRDEFLKHAAHNARFQAFTPGEVDLLFSFASVDSPAGSRLAPSDFRRVVDSAWRKPVSLLDEAVEQAKKKSELTTWEKTQVSIYNFALGSIAGAFGAFMVYPIDLVKTRMQNQRKHAIGTIQYKNSIDCFQKVIRNEGILGLYSGVLPQLIGVAPEKAIKLTVNDLVRTYFTKKDGSIFWGAEVLAGGTAGACQVVFTNPLEIVKIRLQIQGEASKTQPVPKRSAMWIIRHLGFMGLYKGASACLLRDVPFSAIYFPAYSHLKRDLFGETPQKPLGVFQLLTAGAIAGIPAAYLTTPCDVIKTRLQVEARKGDTAYTGLRDAATKIFKEEGATAFFKGGPARIFRSSPQFGFTLAAYEMLHKAFPLPARLAPPKEERRFSDEGVMATPFAASRNALKAVLDIDGNFGRVAVPDKEAWKVLDKAVEAVYS